MPVIDLLASYSGAWTSSSVTSLIAVFRSPYIPYRHTETQRAVNDR